MEIVKYELKVILLIMVKLIIDVDTGVDDAWALFVLLSSRRKDLEILGITCVQGNTTVDNICRNTLHVLETAGRSEVCFHPSFF